MQGSRGCQRRTIASVLAYKIVLLSAQFQLENRIHFFIANLFKSLVISSLSSSVGHKSVCAALVIIVIMIAIVTGLRTLSKWSTV